MLPPALSPPTISGPAEACSATHRTAAQQPAHRVVALEVADDPAAAVNPQHRAGGILWAIAPCADRSGRGRDLEVLDASQLWTEADEVDQGGGLYPGIFGRELVQRRKAGVLDQLEQCLCLGM